MAEKQFYVELGLIAKDLVENLDQSKSALEKFGSEAKSSFEQTGEGWKQITEGAEAFKQKAETALSSVTQKLQPLRNGLITLGDALQKHSTQFTIWGGMITGALSGVILKSAEAGDYLDDLAKSTGVSATELSKLGYVAEQNGASMEQMAMGLKVLYTQMYKAQEGSKEAISLFEKLGVSWANANGELKAGADIIPEIADGVVKLSSDIEKSVVMAELFGRKLGPALIPMMEGGGEGIRELANEAERLGFVIDSVQAKSLGDFNDALTALKASMAGLLRNAVIPLIGTLQPLIDRVTNAVGQFTNWVKTHQELAGVLGKLVGAGGLLLLFAGAVGKLIPLINTLKNIIIPLTTSLHGLNGALNASAWIKFAGAIGLVVTALKELSDWASKPTKDLIQGGNEILQTFENIDSLTLDQLQKGLEEISIEISKLKEQTEEIGFQKGFQGGFPGAKTKTGKELISQLEQLEELYGRISQRIKDIQEGRVPQPAELEIEVPDFTESLASQQIKYLSTLQQFGKITTKQYINILEKMLKQEKLTSDEQAEIENELLSTRLQIYQEAVKGQENASRQMEDIERRRKEVSLSYIDDIKKAQENYEQTIIDYANRLRDEFGKTIDVSKIMDVKSAESFINSIMQELAEERTNIIAKNQEDILNIEKAGAEERIKIQQDLATTIREIEADTQRQIANLQSRQVDVATDTRDAIMEALSKWVPFDDLLEMSFEELIRTYDEYRDKILKNAPESLLVSLPWSVRAKEEYEKEKATKAITDPIDRAITEYRRLKDEQIALEKERQQKIAELQAQAAQSTQESLNKEQQAIKETVQNTESALVNVETRIIQIKEDLQDIISNYMQAQEQMAQQFNTVMGELQQSFSSTLAEYQKYAQESTKVSQDLVKSIPKPEEFFPPDIAINIDLAEKSTKKLGVTFTTAMPEMAKTSAAFSSEIASSMQHLKYSVDESIQSVQQLVNSINSLRDKTVTVTVKRVYQDGGTDNINDFLESTQLQGAM